MTHTKLFSAVLYPDNTVQHAGVVVGIAGFAGHILTGYDRYATGYLWRLATTQDESAVTGACLMVKRSVFEELHGLDESFAVGLNDIDFCLRARALGKLVMNLSHADWRIRRRRRLVFRKRWIISGNVTEIF